MVTGIIDILAGDHTTEGYNGDGGSATTEYLNYPGGLCVDPTNGDILIADMWNNRIRKATQPGYLPTSSVINNNIPSNQFTIFPSPSNGVFTVKTTVTNTNIVVYNSVGEMVYSEPWDNHANTLDLSHLPSGLYNMLFSSAENKEIKKIIISK